MARQRQLQDAILKQVNPVNVVTKFQGIANAGAQVMKTDIPQSMLGYFVDLGMKTRKLPVKQLELVPPLIDPTNPGLHARSTARAAGARAGDAEAHRQVGATATSPSSATPEQVTGSSERTGRTVVGLCRVQV